MENRRIHLTGASGSGVTSLGRALAAALAIPHHDTDDYFWLPTPVPYRQQRPVGDRIRLMREMFLDRPQWVLSGCLTTWGAEIADRFDAVVFVTAPTGIRIERLRQREASRFGDDAIAPGGWHHHEAEEFFAWAERYDDDTFDGRSRRRHQQWLGRLGCAVTHVDGTRPIEATTAHLLAWLADVPQAGTPNRVSRSQR